MEHAQEEGILRAAPRTTIGIIMGLAPIVYSKLQKAIKRLMDIADEQEQYGACPCKYIRAFAKALDDNFVADSEQYVRFIPVPFGINFPEGHYMVRWPDGSRAELRWPEES